MRHFLPTIVLAGLVTAIWMYWKQVDPIDLNASAQAGNADREKHMLTFDPAMVTGLRIRHAREPAIVVKMGANRAWFLESPFTALADAYVVDRTIEMLGQMTIGRMVSADANRLVDFGLQEPEMVIEIESHKEQQRLLVGKASPTGGKVFVAFSKMDGVALVSQKQLALMPRRASELLDRRVLPLARDPLHTVEVKHGD